MTIRFWDAWEFGCRLDRFAPEPDIDDEDTFEGADSERLTDVGVEPESTRATMLPPACSEENDP